MKYPAAAIGAGIGMMIALVVFANAWRIGMLPKGYDFVHEFGRSLVRIDRKPVTYALRFVMGIVFHPAIFVFVWGPDGLLGIAPFDSAVLSAVLLLALESILFAVVLWTRVLGMPPKRVGGPGDRSAVRHSYHPGRVDGLVLRDIGLKHGGADVKA
jgi:hypothetical protein